MLTFSSLNNIYKENCGSAMGYTPVAPYCIVHVPAGDNSTGLAI